MDRIGCTLLDADSYLGAEIQAAGTNALQMTNSVGPDKSSCRRSCASAWNALMKTRRQVLGREWPGRRVQPGLYECLHVRGERFLFVLEHSAPRSRELRTITI